MSITPSFICFISIYHAQTVNSKLPVSRTFPEVNFIRFRDCEKKSEWEFTNNLFHFPVNAGALLSPLAVTPSMKSEVLKHLFKPSFSLSNAVETTSMKGL